MTLVTVGFSLAFYTTLIHPVTFEGDYKCCSGMMCDEFGVISPVLVLRAHSSVIHLPSPPAGSTYSTAPTKHSRGEEDRAETHQHAQRNVLLSLCNDYVCSSVCHLKTESVT